jgi:hypothetical protein
MYGDGLRKNCLAMTHIVGSLRYDLKTIFDGLDEL